MKTIRQFALVVAPLLLFSRLTIAQAPLAQPLADFETVINAALQ